MMDSRIRTQTFTSADLKMLVDCLMPAHTRGDSGCPQTGFVVREISAVAGVYFPQRQVTCGILRKIRPLTEVPITLPPVLVS